MSANANLWVLLGLGIAGILIVTRKLKRVVKEDLGAFVERFELLPPPQPAPPKAPHPLTGLTFAVADVFDIEGYVTGFGNPDWARTHEAAIHTSPLVAALIDGGATCVGKTVIDDMAFSLSGENKYFGTPTNPKAPDRVPGGCSSGSAVAVAGGIVDFALGLDTIGGVRVPGAFCGILGFRPSHDSILNNGVLHVSQSLDTPGLFAKDPSVLRRAAHVLLKLPYADVRPPRRVIIADDCFQLMKISSRRITQVVTKTVEVLFGKQSLSHVNVGEYLMPKVSSLNKFQISSVNGDSKVSSLTSLASAMRLLNKYEFRINHENWINFVKPAIASRVVDNLSTSAEENDILIECCQNARYQAQQALHSLLKDDGILVLPTVSGPPPKLNSKEILSEDHQKCLLNLSAISSMSGCCQITVPLGFHEKFPVSVSFITRHGGDRFLLDTVQAIYSNLQDQADIIVKSSSQSISASKEESAEIAKEKGNNAYKEKQWQKAINLYTEAIKLNGSNATYYSNRAAAYLELGSYLQAEADCSTVINLDRKVDAGADLIITQLFYDTDNFLKFVSDCRQIGITCPIVPGIMPINNYKGFIRMTGFCKTKIPSEITAALDPIKDNEEAVKAYGIHLGTEMCKKILAHGIKTLHLYTLNMEKSALAILLNLGLIEESKVTRSLPWRRPANVFRAKEDVRPIFWANRPKSYILRTSGWDQYPRGRWGDSQNPSYGALTDHQFMRPRARDKKLQEEWAISIRSIEDVHERFMNYCLGKLRSSPWSDLDGLQPETKIIDELLGQINLKGFLTINSQPAVNGVKSGSPTVGWGGPGGYVYQKAYIEFFCSVEKLKQLVEKCKALPSLSYIAVNKEGNSLSNVGPNAINAVTWGVFPAKEIIQPTVVDPASFMVWKDEAFEIWTRGWACLFPEADPSRALLEEVQRSYYLVSLVDNDFIHGDLFAAFKDI